MDIIPFLMKLVVYGLPVVLAITLHEAAHGFVALQCGDNTALRAGRVSFNPLRHVDLFGTIILPGLLLISHAPFLFGYAKPVPVNFGRLRHPRKDTILVTFAGPFTNFALAFISACLFHLLEFVPETLKLPYIDLLKTSVTINVVLGIFNMLPLLPLDGGRILTSLLPRKLAIPFAQSERWGMFILMGSIIILPLILSQFSIKFNPVAWLLGSPIDSTIKIIAKLAWIGS